MILLDTYSLFLWRFLASARNDMAIRCLEGRQLWQHTQCDRLSNSASLPVPEYGSGRFSLQAWDFLAPDKHASGKMKKMNGILADSTLARSLWQWLWKSQIWITPGAARGDGSSPFCSSEGAEYISYGKYFSSGVMPYSKRSFLYSSSNDIFLWCFCWFLMYSINLS